MPSEVEKAIAQIVSEIKGLHPKLDNLSSIYRSRIVLYEQTHPGSVSMYPGSYWQLVAYADTQARIQLLIEQNFGYFETIGVLSISRYILECLIWLRTLKKNCDFGLIYYFQLIEKSIQHLEQSREKTKAEIEFFKQLQVEEQRLSEIGPHGLTLAGKQGHRTAGETLSAIECAAEEVDRRARRKFCIDASQAAINGYSLQAYLMENEVLPRIAAQLTEAQAERESFLREAGSHAPVRLQNWKWIWKDQAAKVEMLEEYNFVYSYTSRLIHATPVSLTTNQKNLEMGEFRMFLNYIYVSILDIIDISTSLLSESKISDAD